jgi:L-cysteate sulfo-lyase
VLVASGGAQSNHARATAAAAARVGLGVVLVLGGTALAGQPGNLALDELLGAEIVLAEGLFGADLDRRVEEVADRLRAAGEVPAVLPFGGSSAVGARGYVDCAAELHQQAPDAAHVVVAVGSGGTMAGLIAGLGPERVLGIDTGALTDPAQRVAALVAQLGGRPGALRLDRDQVGEGYGRLSGAAAAAMRTAARTEGLLLDPVYTGKAIAGLASAVSEGIVRPGERTVFVHTGGLPGLFGHRFAAELAAVAIGSGRRGLTGAK